MKLKEEKFILEKYKDRYSPESNCFDVIVFDKSNELVYFSNNKFVRNIVVDTVEETIKNDILFNYDHFMNDIIEGEAIGYYKEFNI